MKALKILFVLFFVICMTSCYDNYISDYEYSATGFAIRNPLRTTIADRDMEIYVGVAISGKRAVNMKDWAAFEIIPDSVPPGYYLLPTNYYTLSDPNTMRVRKSNLPVADVGIKFTEDFYNDTKAIGKYYVLPFKITESSLDSIRPDADVSIVAIKFISTFHGTYYIKGTMEEYDLATDTVKGITVYNNEKDKITRDLTTVSRNVLTRPVANSAATSADKLQLTFEMNDSKDRNYNVLLQAASTTFSLINGSATYYGDRDQPEIELSYSYSKNGRYYRVKETMELRQDPLYDLRVETW